MSNGDSGSPTIGLYNDTDNEWLIKANTGAAVELYHDGTKKLETSSSGASVLGSLYCSAHLNLTNDNKKINLGDSSDLQIYHDGNNSYVEDAGTGSLILKTGRVSFNDTGNNEMGRFDGEGLKFNGDSAAANALDDYEEGTFDAYIGGQTNHATYNTNGNGEYTKIGRFVTVHGYFAGINLDDSASGQVQIYNLPFTPATVSYGGQATASVHTSNVTFDTSKRQCWRVTSTGLIGNQATSNGTHVEWNVSDFTSSSTFIWFTATYRV